MDVAERVAAIVPPALHRLRTTARDRLRERRANRVFEDRDNPSSGRVASDAPRHVVCVVIDALRADAIDATNAPFLDSLFVRNAITPATWTFPAVTSLLTGQYPHTHGAMRRADTFENSVADMTGMPPPLDDSTPLVSEILADAGYRTYGGFGMLVPFLALSGRFSTHRLYDDAPADRILSDHLAWIEQRDERTFSYLHLADLHEPVSPPEAYWNAHDVDASIPKVRTWDHEDVTRSTPTVSRYREHRQRLYRAAVEYVDNRMSAYYERSTDLVGNDDICLVIVGDHGEGFWEHTTFDATHFADPRPAYCVGHGGTPYEVVTCVPLCTSGFDTATGIGDELASGEGNENGRDGTPLVSLVDIAPLLLDRVGLSATHEMDGVSLLSAVPANRRMLVEGTRYGYEKKTVYGAGRKLLVSRGDDFTGGFSPPPPTMDRVTCRLRPRHHYRPRCRHGPMMTDRASKRAPIERETSQRTPNDG